MSENEWVQIASAIGIPAAICFFVLIRLEKALADLKGSIDHLKDQIRDAVIKK